MWEMLCEALFAYYVCCSVVGWCSWRGGAEFEVYRSEETR